MGVDGFVCFQNIYSYIATVPAVEQWYFHLCSATLGLYPISSPIRHTYGV